MLVTQYSHLLEKGNDRQVKDFESVFAEWLALKQSVLHPLDQSSMAFREAACVASVEPREVEKQGCVIC